MNLVTELITPFNEYNEIDYSSLSTLIYTQKKLGITDFYINDELSEFIKLSLDKRKEYLQFLKELSPDSKLYLEIPFHEYLLYYETYSLIDCFVLKDFNNQMLHLKNMNRSFYLLVNHNNIDIINQTNTHTLLEGIVVETLDKFIQKKLLENSFDYKIMTKDIKRIKNYKVDALCSFLPLIIGKDIDYYLKNINFNNNIEIIEDYIFMISDYFKPIQESVENVKYVLFKKNIINSFKGIDLIPYHKKLLFNQLATHIY